MKAPTWSNYTVTDDEGYYEATGLHSTSYTLKRGQSESYVHDYQQDEKRVEVAVGDRFENIDFPMDRGSSVSGQVVDESGAPIAGVPIAAGGTGSGHVIYKAAVLSDDSGNFTLYGFGPDTEIRLSTRMPGFILKTEPIITFGESDVTAIELVLSSRNSVRGVVLDAGGQPRTDVFVHARLRDPAPGERNSYGAKMNRRTGSFVFSNIAIGDYDFYIWPHFYSKRPKPTSELSLRKGQHIDGIELTYNGPKTRSISGIIVGPNGRPVRAASITIPGLNGFGIVPYSLENGVFSMDCVPEGTWQLRVDKEGFSTTLVDGVSAGAEGVKIVLSE